MPQRRFWIAGTLILAMICLFPVVSTAESPAGGYKVIYSFTGSPDGSVPLSDLTFDAEGNLYGTTSAGGAYGYGTVFELKYAGDSWQEEVLYSFTGNSDGAYSNSGVILDNAGSLYGFTAGHYDTGPKANVFKLTPGSGGWTESVIYSFDAWGGLDWPDFQSDLIIDAHGDLFGTLWYTYGGSCGYDGCVFKLIPQPDGKWRQETLYNFAGRPDGSHPYSSPVLDSSGNLYGTTMAGGSGTCHPFYPGGCGIAYELTHGSDGKWTENILYNFVRGGGNAVTPFAAFALMNDGHILATSADGGDGLGTVFELKKSKKGWEQDVLHRFYGGQDGDGPIGRLINLSGALFGVTGYTVFELDASKTNGWKEKILHTFAGGVSDGDLPAAGLVADSHGRLYGTTLYGGSGQCGYGSCGLVYEITLEGGER